MLLLCLLRNYQTLGTYILRNIHLNIETVILRAVGRSDNPGVQCGYNLPLLVEIGFTDGGTMALPVPPGTTTLMLFSRIAVAFQDTNLCFQAKIFFKLGHAL